MKTALIFAYACAPYNPPESTVGAQRPAQFAKYLPRFGWRAIVLCLDGRAPPLDRPAGIRQQIENALASSGPDRSVIIPLPALRYDGTLDRLWRWMSARRRGTRVWGALRSPLTLAKFFSGDYSQNWQPVARIAAGEIAARIPIDVCVGEHSPDAGIFLARWFSSRHQVPWIADFRDAMLFGQRAALRRLLAPAARRMLRTATHVVNVTPPCVEIDSRILKRPVQLITNGFDPEEFAGEAPRRDDGKFAIVLAGSIWVRENLEMFIQGLELLSRRLRDGADTIRFRYFGDAAEMVRQAATGRTVASLVEVHGRVPRRIAIAETRSADLLLILTPANYHDPYWDRGGYPGKIFEYLGARRPILSIPPDGGTLDELLARTGAGVTAAAPEEIADRLEEAWRQWRATGHVRYSADPAAIAEFSRERSAEKLSVLLDSAARCGMRGGMVFPQAEVPVSGGGDRRAGARQRLRA